MANSSTSVDLPIRLAPSMSKAVSPLLSCFHLSILSYSLRLKTLFFVAIFFQIFTAKIRLLPKTAKCFRPKMPKSAKCFGHKMPKTAKCWLWEAPASWGPSALRSLSLSRGTTFYRGAADGWRSPKPKSIIRSQFLVVFVSSTLRHARPRHSGLCRNTNGSKMPKETLARVGKKP